MERLEPGLPQQAGGEMAKVAALHGAVGGVSLFDAHGTKTDRKHETYKDTCITGRSMG